MPPVVVVISFARAAATWPVASIVEGPLCRYIVCWTNLVEQIRRRPEASRAPPAPSRKGWRPCHHCARVGPPEGRRFAPRRGRPSSRRSAPSARHRARRPATCAPSRPAPICGAQPTGRCSGHRPRRSPVTSQTQRPPGGSSSTPQSMESKLNLRAQLAALGVGEPANNWGDTFHCPPGHQN